MTEHASAPDLAHRYGRPRPRRGRVVLVVGVLLTVVGGGWLAWTAWFHGTPEATSALVRWEVVGDTEVDVTFDVRLSGDVEAQCRVEAYDVGKVAVGSEVVVVPTEAGDADGGRISTTIRTTSRATAVEMIGCTTPEQRRPR